MELQNREKSNDQSLFEKGISKSEILKRLFKLIGKKIANGLKVALPTSILVFRFLEWWYSVESLTKMTYSKLPQPPPAAPVIAN